MEKYINKDLDKIKKIKITSNKGIYFLYDNDTIVYIGKSKNLASRILAHTDDGVKIFNSYKILIIPKNENLTMIEKFYIEKYKPKYNKNCNIDYKMQKKSKIKIVINILDNN